MVRVVLPHTPNPNGLGPMTTLLSGPIYKDAGRWQTLRFSDLENDIAELLQERLWVLRREHGSQVTTRKAYVDAVLLNLYTSSGNAVVELDRVQLKGPFRPTWRSSPKARL